MTGEEQPTTVSASSLFGDREVALVDLLDRLLSGGVVLAGDLTISLAGVDLVRVSLRALITSVTPAAPAGPPVRHVDAVVDRPELGPGHG